MSPRPSSRRVSKFLSTPSARRATLLAESHKLLVCISIHALREEGDEGVVPLDVGQNISIHALREEGDLTGDDISEVTFISIHALREEGDDLS